MRPNPFLKFMGPEDHFQHQVITWLGWQHPDLKYHHSPDAGQRSPFEKFKYVYLGSDSGFPDLVFPSLLMVLELKVKPNKPSVAQLGWLEFFKSIGWDTHVPYKFEEVVSIINFRIKSFEAIPV